MSPSHPELLPPGRPGSPKDASSPDANKVTAVAGSSSEMPEARTPQRGGGAQPSTTTSSEDLIDLSDDISNTSQPGAAPEEGLGIKFAPATPSASSEAEPDREAYPLESSVATLKPTTTPATATTTTTQYLNIEPSTYIDPTPQTPLTSPTPSRTPSNAPRSRHAPSTAETSPIPSEIAEDDRRYMSEDDQENGSRSEIQSIMEQFSEEGGGPGAEEVMSPRLEMASPLLGSPVQHPPRKSSLEPLASNLAHQIQEFQGLRVSSSSPASVRSKQKDPEDHGPPVPPKDVSPGIPQDMDNPLSPTMSLHRPPPPEPEPESSLPFDFHRFLEQLRNKKADPVARYLKSFLSEFSKKQWMVHEQVKIIGDFLAFIANKMAVCDVWKEVSDAEFDNAREGMEKLVMNRLYSQTFSPAIPPPQPIPGLKPKRRGVERPLGPGRRGQHQEDVERDEILAQKVNIYGWVREEHLDIPAVGDSGKRFLKLAQQELLKIKSYRAPRDKIICVLNCCKVIFGLLKHSKSDSSADSFMPLLIYVVLQANPEHLVSNVQYILRFRNQDKLGGEAGYYLSSLMGAIQFVENMDRTTLTITDEEFESNVEAAVSAIAEKHRAESPPLPPAPPLSEKTGYTLHPPSAGESSTARLSLDSDARPGTPRMSTSSEGNEDEKAAISGLLRTIGRPLSTIGRMFSDEPTTPAGPSSRSPARTPQPDGHSPRPSTDGGARPPSRHALSAEEAAARQASAETAEAQRLHRAEHANIVETLAGMFPDLDRDLISDVVYQKEGRVGLAVDACLALSS